MQKGAVASRPPRPRRRESRLHAAGGKALTVAHQSPRSLVPSTAVTTAPVEGVINAPSAGHTIPRSFSRTSSRLQPSDRCDSRGTFEYTSESESEIDFGPFGLIPSDVENFEQLHWATAPRQSYSDRSGTPSLFARSEGDSDFVVESEASYDPFNPPPVNGHLVPPGCINPSWNYPPEKLDQLRAEIARRIKNGTFNPNPSQPSTPMPPPSAPAASAGPTPVTPPAVPETTRPAHRSPRVRTGSRHTDPRLSPPIQDPPSPTPSQKQGFQQQEARIADLQQENTALRLKLADIERQHAPRSQGLDTFTPPTADSEPKHGVLGSAVGGLDGSESEENATGSSRQELVVLQQQVEALTRENVQLTKDRQALQSQMVSFTTEVTTLKGKLQATAADHSKAVGEYHRALLDNQEIKAQLAQAEQRCDEVQQNYDCLQQRYDHLVASRPPPVSPPFANQSDHPARPLSLRSSPAPSVTETLYSHIPRRSSVVHGGPIPTTVMQSLTGVASNHSSETLLNGHPDARSNYRPEPFSPSYGYTNQPISTLPSPLAAHRASVPFPYMTSPQVTSPRAHYGLGPLVGGGSESARPRGLTDASSHSRPDDWELARNNLERANHQLHSELQASQQLIQDKSKEIDGLKIQLNMAVGSLKEAELNYQHRLVQLQSDLNSTSQGKGALADENSSLRLLYEDAKRLVTEKDEAYREAQTIADRLREELSLKDRMLTKYHLADDEGSHLGQTLASDGTKELFRLNQRLHNELDIKQLELTYQQKRIMSLYEGVSKRNDEIRYLRDKGKRYLTTIQTLLTNCERVAQLGPKVQHTLSYVTPPRSHPKT
ncbi:hypothetical protein H4R35_001813 [Dimargaris xerosporica]|nr:hypothetical protein H4R35_001813 [Dimargaris xerosporica]